jgi:uncharacterized protein YeeX (DUF496 family)
MNFEYPPPPKLKKNKRSGYHNKEKEPPKKIAPKKTTNGSPKPTVKNSIKKAISSAIEYVKSFKRKSKKNSNNEDLQEKIEDTKLEVLENEMIHMVENVVEHVNDVENSVTADANIMNQFGDIIKNLTIELHNAIGYTEQINAIEQAKANEQASANNQPIIIAPTNVVDQSELNFNELNNILNFLAENILDNNKKKKELSFTELAASNKKTSTYTIRVITLGIAISYTTLEEFLEKIASRAGTVKSLCWFAGCPEKFNTELKKFIELNNATQKDYNKIFKIFKKMIDAYLSIKNPEIHSKIVHLISSTSGGKKGKSRKPRKPRKSRKPRKPRKPKKT